MAATSSAGVAFSGTGAGAGGPLFHTPLLAARYRRYDCGSASALCTKTSGRKLCPNPPINRSRRETLDSGLKHPHISASTRRLSGVGSRYGSHGCGMPAPLIVVVRHYPRDTLQLERRPLAPVRAITATRRTLWPTRDAGRRIVSDSAASVFPG